jgi:hypothetical protein
VSQDDATVTADVLGPDGPYQERPDTLSAATARAAGSTTWPASRAIPTVYSHPGLVVVFLPVRFREQSALSGLKTQVA